MLIKMNERTCTHVRCVYEIYVYIYRKREKLPDGSATNAVVYGNVERKRKELEKICVQAKETENKRLTIAHVLFIIGQILCNSKG